ncbi:MAG: acyl-CoA dehydrogenase family protein, partial [Jiangellales bacterium]
MEFALSPRAAELQADATAFLNEHVLPAEAAFHEQSAAMERDDTWGTPPAVAELKTVARERGLWNLFMPDPAHGPGVSVLDYAPTAEVSGWSPWLMPEAMNCSAPDTGNMELLAMFATPEQAARWLEPLLDGEMRSCFSMTEPDVASSDARNIAATIARDGDEYVITGRKWWSTGGMSPACKVAIVMGVTDPDAHPYRQQSMVLVPLDIPGVTVERSTTVFGYTDRAHGGHAVISFDGARVPVTNLLGEEGAGFAMAQARLGPGRIHHCMRLIGMAERALDTMVRRAAQRTAFGRPLAAQGVVREQISRGRLAIDQARLLVLRTAWQIDTVGAKEAAAGIAGIKAVVPAMACQVIDDAIQVLGGLGVSDDDVLASLYAGARTLRIADGPDEVHHRSVARAEM